MDSVWLQVALDRLDHGMPFFGLMHRLAESFELMGFHLCFPIPRNSKITEIKKRPPHEPPKDQTREFDETVQRTFALDALLLKEAETRFDRLLSNMRQKKAAGILCDLSKVLNRQQHQQQKQHQHRQQKQQEQSTELSLFGLQCVNHTIIS
eukprot:scaffold67855_cov35-Attheya_sp.AAC.1